MRHDKVLANLGHDNFDIARGAFELIHLISELQSW